ncbi:NfeD family protein [Agreia sp. COWG]|uniref:NfeD family protein n=1 Tax=Agreia sp. COWG TaxID=2773266 RepID=UPI001AF9FB70|nr:NfeD family protein [Agreia sp. COWG]CAD5997748.1 Putative activity regulator of membrane protease YbbK [Agreia sp. COWG]
MIDFLASYAWTIWLALVLVFLIVEMFSLEFTFLMIALGSVGGLVSSLVGVPWFMQIVIAAALALVLILTIRPPLLRALRRGGDPTKSNMDALIGLEGIVTTPLTGDSGHVKLANGDIWTARVSPSTDKTDVALGRRVLVTAIEGATAFVVPAERNAL